MQYRKSKLRDRILALLQESNSHPTAADVYDSLKPDYPSLSQGTVYRNLGILVEQGRIKSLPCGKTFDRYDAVLRDHSHLICTRCGTIMDLELPLDENIEERVSRETGFKVTRRSLEFYGICAACQ